MMIVIVEEIPTENAGGEARMGILAQRRYSRQDGRRGRVRRSVLRHAQTQERTNRGLRHQNGTQNSHNQENFIRLFIKEFNFKKKFVRELVDSK